MLSDPCSGATVSPDRADSRLDRALKHDVRRFEIAVHDALGVRRVQGFANLHRDREGLIDSKRPARDAMGQRFAFYELEHQKEGLAGFLEIVNRRNARMVQRGEHSRLTLEAR